MQFGKVYAIMLALILFFVGVLSFGLALGWTTPLTYLELFLRGSNERWMLGILGVISILIGFIILRKSLRVKTSTQTEVISTKLGKIKITISALEHMATKVAKEIEGVMDTKPVIKSTPGGIAVFMQVNLAPDINIPDTTSLVQDKIKVYFGQVVGIEVEEVRILVSKLGAETKARVE